MTGLVQVALAENVTDAEEIRTMLSQAGIDSVLEQAVEHHATGTEDAPQRVLVAESDIEAARDAIEAQSEPDELTDD